MQTNILFSSLLICVLLEVLLLRNKSPILLINESNYPLSRNISKKHTLYYIPKKHYVSSKRIFYEIPRNELAPIKFYNDKEMAKVNETESPMHTLKDDPMNDAAVLDAHITHLKDVYVNYAASIITPDFEYLNISKGRGPDWIRLHKPGSLVSIQNSVVALGHMHMGCFSHWFYDYLAPLTMVPENIIKTSKFILDVDRDYTRKTLKAFGIKDDQIIIIGLNWVYAFNVYIATDPSTHISHTGIAMRDVGEKMKKYFNLTSIAPTEFCLINRKKGLARCLGNIEELYENVKAKYPKENFKLVVDPFTVIESAKLWATFKFLFAPTGSNCIKLLFMHEYSVLVVALADLRDDCIGMAASVNKIFTLFFANPQIPHFKLGTFNVNINKSMKCIDIGVRCAKTGRWGTNNVFDANLS